jgi:hypothetical protein
MWQEFEFRRLDARGADFLTSGRGGDVDLNKQEQTIIYLTKDEQNITLSAASENETSKSEYLSSPEGLE